LKKYTGYVSEVLHGEDGKAIVTDNYWNGGEPDQETILEWLLSYQLIKTFKVLRLYVAFSRFLTEEVIGNKV
jgi:hypothetical protein